MNPNTSKSLRKSVVLGALLLLAATASGCGVGMPTAPSIDASISDPGASAGVQARFPGMGPEEMDDPTLGGGSYQSPVPSDPEIFIPTAGPGNSDWGHNHKKPKTQD